jgi:predicted small secreted protein
MQESRNGQTVRALMAQTPRWSDVLAMNKKHLSILLVTALLALLNTGCRTMEGAGEDIERAGEKIQDNADR